MLINRRLLDMTRANRALLVAVTAVLCAVTMSYWFQAWLLAQALASLVGLAHGADANAVPFLVAVLGCGVFRLLLQQLHGRLASGLGSAVRLELRRRLMERLMRPERLRDTSDRTGARRLALSEGVEGVDSYVSQYIAHAFQLQLLCPLLLLIVAVLNPWLAAALTVAVLVAVAAPRLWGKVLSRRGQEHWDSYESLSADFLESLQGMRTLRILDAVPRVRARLKVRSDKLHRATVATMRTSLVDTALADFGIQAGLLAASVLAGLASLGVVDVSWPGAFGWGRPDAAATYFVLLLSSEVFRPVRDLARQWHTGYLGLSALGSIDAAGAADVGGAECGAECGAADTGSARRDSQGNAKGDGLPDELSLEGLSFRYGADTPWILKDVTVVLRRGGITALSGASGTGKSTLFDLLLGFLPATGAGMLLDGRPLAPGDVSVVSQRSYLFPGTVRENLMAVAPQASPEQLQAAIEAASLEQLLASWPKGLDTVLAEAGGSVSGGQLQRLAIARALLADRPVLLLDEPSSALNAELAGQLMVALRMQARQRIVLMIAHRPEALAAATTVLKLEDGVLRDVSLEGIEA